MAMNILSISNTTRGSFNNRTQEYEVEVDRSGRPIYSDTNFRITTTPDSVAPSTVTAQQITKLIKFASKAGVELSTKSGVQYEHHRKENLDAKDDNGILKPPAISWYYRPEREPMGEFDW